MVAFLHLTPPNTIMGPKQRLNALCTQRQKIGKILVRRKRTRQLRYRALLQSGDISKQNNSFYLHPFLNFCSLFFIMIQTGKLNCVEPHPTQLFVCCPKNWSSSTIARQWFAYCWPSGNNNYISERPVFWLFGIFWLCNLGCINTDEWRSQIWPNALWVDN